MKTESIIENKINAALKVSFLGVINESDQHGVPPNSQTHFKVTVVSDEFEGMRLIARHRFLNDLLKEELNNGVHALALHLFTPSQWENKKNLAPHSPNCLGGGL